MTDWSAEGMLDGLGSDDEREARRELLDRLHAEGCSVDELRQAIADDRLALLPVEKLLLRDRRYTMAETAELTGLSMDYLKADWRALGFSLGDPDDRWAGDREIASLRAIRWMIDEGMSEAQLLELTRMVGDASSKLTDAILGIFAETLLKPGDSERDLGLRLVDIANALMPQLGDMLRGPMELHLADAVRREAVGGIERAQGIVPGSRPVAICFADMVGFTRLSEQTGIDGVRDVTKRFVEVAADVAEAPVRLVKTIGDEAMLASEDAAALVAAGLAFVDAAARDDTLPPVRAGAAAGQALRRAGDWYGRPVNLAARITGVAPAGELIGDAALREAAGDGFEWNPAGHESFKGIDGQVELYQVARG
jgi:adenylate cyclase